MGRDLWLARKTIEEQSNTRHKCPTCGKDSPTCQHIHRDWFDLRDTSGHHHSPVCDTEIYECPDGHKWYWDVGFMPCPVEGCDWNKGKEDQLTLLEPGEDYVDPEESIEVEDKYSTVIKWSDEDNKFVAVCPEIPSISALGSTREEAAKEISTVIALAIETFEEDGTEVPEPNKI